MDWIRDFTEENFLAVYDVALDIRADLQLGQKPCIPMVPSVVKFPLLMPMDGTNMRDRYGNLRWKAMEFLKGKEVIQKIDLLQGGHRWETQADLQVDSQLFQQIFPALEAEYHRRTQPDEPAREGLPVDTSVKDVKSASTDFEKVTIPWLVNHLPIRYWIYACGFLIAIFIAGIQVGQLGSVRELIGKSASNMKPVEPSAIESSAIQKQIEKLTDAYNANVQEIIRGITSEEKSGGIYPYDLSHQRAADRLRKLLDEEHKKYNDAITNLRSLGSPNNGKSPSK